MFRLPFLRLCSLPPDFSCLPLRLRLLDGSTHKENSLVLRAVMEQSRVEQQRRGKIANCALLRDNIVMLDYPSACWHRPASPWTHNPAEKQPSANGVFFSRWVVFCIYSAVRHHTDLRLGWSSFVRYFFPLCFTLSPLLRRWTDWTLSFFVLCYNSSRSFLHGAGEPWSHIQWIMPLLRRLGCIAWVECRH